MRACDEIVDAAAVFTEDETDVGDRVNEAQEWDGSDDAIH
jgi:hypothetical protein